LPPRLVEQSFDKGFDLIGFGKAIALMFGKELPVVEEDLEGSRFTRRDGDAREVIVIVVEQVLRQTGGA